LKPTRVKSRFDTVMHGVVSRYVATGTGIVASIILTPFLLSHLGREVYGLYAALGSIMAFLFILEFGTGSAVPKYVAEMWAQEDMEGLSRLVSSFFFTFLALSLVLIVAAFVCLPLVPHLFKTSPELVRTAELVFFITVANFSIVLPFSTLGGLLFGLHRVHITYWLDGLFYVLNVLGAYVALKFHCGLVGVALGTLGARILVTFLLAWFARTSCPTVTFSVRCFDWRLVNRLAAPSFYYFVIDLATLVILSTDHIIISSFIGVAAVSAYSIAFRLWKIPAGLINSVSNVLLPHISELDVSGNLPRLRALHTQLTKYSMLLAMTAFVCVTAFGEKLIGLWVGPENFVGTPVLLCFTVLFPLYTVVASSSEVLMGMGKHKKLAWVLLPEGILNVALSILLLHRLGVLGVALGTLISRLVTSFWFAPWYVCRLLGEDFRQYVRDLGLTFIPVIPSLGLALLLRRWSGSPLLLVFGGSLAASATYFVFFYKFSLSQDDRNFLRSHLASLCGRSPVTAWSLRFLLRSEN
jgi:O-antigen/teichoic acid export membrane protein